MPARYENIAERHLDPKVRGSQEYMCRCPFCSGDSSLQFNIDNGLWVCFRCDAKGNAKTLVKRLGGVWTDPALSTEHIRERMDKMRIDKKKAGRDETTYDDTYLKRFDFPDEYWSEQRGFSDETIRAFNLGYDPLKDRHTIGVRNMHGEVLGIIYRLKGKDVFPRYIYYEGFDRKNSLYGSWIIASAGTKKVALVEGSTDVMALHDSRIPALAQYGSSISRGQVRLLHRLGVTEVVLFYDYDEAGLKALERSQKMIRGIRLRAVQWDTTKYCWHKKLCGCGQHTWRTIGKCENKKLCKCGRIHEADPGSLKSKEKKRMWRNAVLIGTKDEQGRPRV